MINNRQAGRRNRGRNNGRPNNNSRGGGDNGNRIDNRARGNAPQLLEKYKNLARDAQLAGDRVNAEYYLQFADHYFRVLADNRTRQEEQQQRYRPQDDNFDDMGEQGYEEGADQAEGYEGDVADNARPHYTQRQDMGERRDDRRERTTTRRDNRPRNGEQPGAREGRSDSDDRSATREYPVSASVEPQEAEGDVAPRRRGRPPRRVVEESGEAALDVTVLPPAIGRSDVADDAPVAEEAPRKRGRRPKAASAEAAE